MNANDFTPLFRSSLAQTTVQFVSGRSLNKSYQDINITSLLPPR